MGEPAAAGSAAAPAAAAEEAPPPAPELSEAQMDSLGALIESYMTDENLPSNDFLFFKYLRGRSRGWVTITTLQTLTRVKRTAASAEQIADAVDRRAASVPDALLEVSPDRRAVRRTRPLPEGFVPARPAQNGAAGAHEDRQAQGRTVRVENLNSLLPRGERRDATQDDLLRYFQAKFGQAGVTSVVITQDKTKKGRFPPRPHGLVELASAEMAQQAVDSHAGSDWRFGLQVKLERARPRRQSVAQNDSGDEASAPAAKPASAAAQNGQVQGAAAADADADADEEATDKAGKARTYKGKVRTLDPSNMEGFIAPITHVKKGRKAPKLRSLCFACREDPDLYANLSVGSVVSYQVQTDENGMQTAINVAIVERKGDDSNDDGELPENPSFESAIRRSGARSARSDKPTSGVNNCSYAVGPPNDFKYKGFGSKEWRGVVRRTAA